ncbi:MAG: DinB family protein [bacterium]
MTVQEQLSVKALVLDHLKYTFEKESWQPPLSTAVAGLTAQQAAWKPAPERHSIWQIVRHVTHWKRSVGEALEGRPLSYEELEETDWPEATGDEAAWQADVRALFDITRRIREHAESMDETALAERRVWYEGKTEWAQTAGIRLVRMATHDIYHSGQIRYLRALQGA